MQVNPKCRSMCNKVLKYELPGHHKTRNQKHYKATQKLTTQSLSEEKVYRNSHGNHGRFLLFSVNVLNKSLRHKVIPTVLGGFLPYYAGSESGKKEEMYEQAEEIQQYSEELVITPTAWFIYHYVPHLHLQGSNILLLDEQALLLHNEERTTATSVICVQP